MGKIDTRQRKEKHVQEWRRQKRKYEWQKKQDCAKGAYSVNQTNNHVKYSLTGVES